MGKSKQNIQKVKVINFPTKDKWDRLQIVATIISLIVAVISLVIASISTCLYIKEINRSPDMYVSVGSPTPILHKAIFEFADSNLSEPLEFNVSVHNKGRKQSVSLTKLFLLFDKNIEVSLISHGLWQETPLSEFKGFNYAKDEFVVNPDTNRLVGRFDLRIPKQRERLLVAYFIIEGDFRMKSGLLYYDYVDQMYSVDHFTDPKKPEQIWNKHIEESE